MENKNSELKNKIVVKNFKSPYDVENLFNTWVKNGWNISEVFIKVVATNSYSFFVYHPEFLDTNFLDINKL